MRFPELSAFAEHRKKCSNSHNHHNRTGKICCGPKNAGQIFDFNLSIYKKPKNAAHSTAITAASAEKGTVPEEEYLIPLGKADVKRTGKDVSIITCGRMVQMSLLAAAKLAEEGIDAEVLDLRTLSPLDTDAIIATVKKTGRAVIVHEAAQFADFGGEIAGVIADSEAFYRLDAPIKRVGAYTVPFRSTPSWRPRHSHPGAD